MSKQTALGATYSVSAAAPATYDQVGFEALTFTEVSGVTNIGEFGPTFEDVTTTPLKEGIVEHYKGAVDYGELALTVDADATDAGLTILKDGVDGANKAVVHSHKVELDGGEVYYFTGQIFSAPLSVADASSMVTRAINIKLNNKPVEI